MLRFNTISFQNKTNSRSLTSKVGQVLLAIDNNLSLCMNSLLYTPISSKLNMCPFTMPGHMNTEINLKP